MIISCPACQAKYNVSPQSLGAMGRVVRCARCKHQWHAQAPEDAKPVQTPPLPPRPVDYKPQLPALATQRGDNWYLPAAVVLFTLVIGGFWLFKDHIQQAFPMMETAMNPLQSAQEIRTLDAKKPDTASLGLVVGDISRQIEEQDGFVTYVVRGTITNTNGSEKRVPNLRVALLDGNGVQLDAWRVQPERRILESGATTKWVCLFYDPPLADINEFSISFVEK